MLLKLSSLCIILSQCLAGCAGRRVVTLETCVTFPKSGQLACTKRDGSQYLLPFAHADDYVCRPTQDDLELLMLLKDIHE